MYFFFEFSFFFLTVVHNEAGLISKLPMKLMLCCCFCSRLGRLLSLKILSYLSIFTKLYVYLSSNQTTYLSAGFSF